MTPCDAYADHVDHVVPRSRWAGRPRNGSTTRWRRVRLLVLERDGFRCQLPVDERGNYDPAADELEPTYRGTLNDLSHPDDPRNLRAACALHNLQRGDGTRPAPAAAGRRRPEPRWEW